jgi:putative selenium metabolism hydrolase
MHLSSLAVLEKAKSYRDATADLLSRIIRVPALSGAEQERIGLLQGLCQQGGFEEVRIDGLGNLLARVGHGPCKLVFDAHIDTVDIGDRSQWKLDPFSGLVKDGLVHGLGASDQLGGAAAMLTAGRILSELGYAGRLSVWFAFTVMEEDCDGMCWRYLIEREGFRPDFFVSTEPTSCRLYRGHRGRMEVEARFKGLACHGSAPERGRSAATMAAKAVLAIEQLNSELQPDDDGFLGKGTIVVSKVEASGPSLCAVPDQGMIYMDRRLTWGETMDLAVEQVRSAILAAGVEAVEVRVPGYEKPSWKGTVHTQELYFPTWRIPADHLLVRAGVAAHAALFGAEPAVDKWTFSTNGVAVCGRHGVPSIGFGPGDEWYAHAPNEVTRIDDLERCSAFYAGLPYVLESLV